MIAVANENCNPIEIRKLLEEDPSMLNKNNLAGDTPLHFAICHGHSVENVIELLKQGARVDNVHFNTTPLHTAAGRNSHLQYAMLKVLLEYGGQVNNRDFHNRTPLHILLETMKEDFQERSLYLLLSNGADVNAIDNENISILKVALMNPCISLNSIKMLLEFGANANDCIGYSVRELPVAKLLLQYILIKRMAKAELEPNLTDFNTYSSLLPKKILDLKFCEHLRYYRELVAYRNGCIRELIAMRGERISKNCTLFLYINERCSCAKVNEDDLKTSLTKKVLSKFNQYPYCKDLITASLKKRCILEELCNEKIYTWQQISDCSLEKYKVHLNSDTIQTLATYLIKSDMINLTLAYRYGYEASLELTKRVNCEKHNLEHHTKRQKVP
nr:transient receptor potential cation channel subfamily A member 1-like [Parasteatoda tepidariorum]